MKPHNLIKTDDDKQLDNQSAYDVVAEKQDDKTVEKLLSSLAAIAVVFCIFALAPYFTMLLPNSQSKVDIVKPEPQVQLSAEHLEAYVWTAKLKLEDLKLNHRLKISSSVQSEIKIDGNISKQETSSWNNF